uniref:Uncharacterized protein n=2 Tax=Rhizophagus irregularis TaxID=588596 RepID=U9T1L0_RHIID
MDAEILTMGFAQATVQMESSLSSKRKSDEIDDENGLDKVWDCKRCREMVLHGMYEGKSSFKLSIPLFVVYEDEDTEDKAEKVLGHIIWLFEETQKQVEASQSGVKG